jgi:Asp/Glu/hydantoin racemase
MRLMLINPNTTKAITTKVVAEAQRIAGAGIDIIPVTGQFGARYIASRAAYAVAAHAALDAYSGCGEPHDAVMLGCFGDPGLDALREISPRPVIGMADASIASAAERGASFSIVTGGERWVAMLEEFVASRGHGSRLASVRAVSQTGGAIAADPDAALEALAQACQAAADRDGAEAVILGGAGLAGLTARIKDKVSVPLIDCVEAMVTAAVAAARGSKTSAGPAAMTPGVESVGLSAALARHLP